MSATTYHDKKGKFCDPDSAHLVTKGGDRYKVVRQHRRVGGSKKSSQRETVDPFRRVEFAKQRAAMLGKLAGPGWVNLSEGIAAYNRGSRAISRQISRELGHNVDAVGATPVPRPKDWGSKSYQKALRHGQGLLKYAKTRGIDYTVDDLADSIREYTKASKKMAMSVAQELMGG